MHCEGDIALADNNRSNIYSGIGVFCDFDDNQEEERLWLKVIRVRMGIEIFLVL